MDCTGGMRPFSRSNFRGAQDAGPPRTQAVEEAEPLVILHDLHEHLGVEERRGALGLRVLGAQRDLSEPVRSKRVGTAHSAWTPTRVGNHGCATATDHETLS